MNLIRRMTSLPLHRMTSLRLLRVYFAVFAIALVGLAAFIGWISSKEIARETDSVLGWQMRYLRLTPDAQLADTIRRRVANGSAHIHYYGLFDSDGKRIAGDVLALPATLPTWPHGETLDHTLRLSGVVRAPVVRVMAVRRTDGRILLVGQDMTDVLSLHRLVVSLLAAGAALGLAMSGAAAIAIALRQMKRIEAVGETAALIARGDLSHRFKTGGPDEISMLLHLVNHMLDEVERLMAEVKGACDGIAHDLRTPLARIRTLVVRASHRPSALERRPLKEMLDQARQETDAVLERFGAMLRVAQIAGLTRRGEFGLVDLRELVLDIGGLYAPLAESRGITLATFARDEAFVRADRALLFEMLGNLLAHALCRVASGATLYMRIATTDSGPRIVIEGERFEQSLALEATAQARESSAVDRARLDEGAGANGCVECGYTGLSLAWAVARMHGFALHLGCTEHRVAVDCWPQMSLKV
jgi:signal transduction histidine kinase